MSGVKARLDPLLARRPRRIAVATVFSAAAVAVVTGIVFALTSYAPALSLGVLYVFAVLPVAVLFGMAYAIAVSIASMLALNWFFLPPLHTFPLEESGSWISLAVYLVTAFVVSEFAARARRRAADAEQRRREAALLADVSGILLEADHVQEAIRDVAARAATALGAKRARIELRSLRRPAPGEAAYELVARGENVGRLFLDETARPPVEVAERVLPALASLLAVAEDRERLRARLLDAETLRKSDAIKTALLRAVSHDFRSPLTAIRAGTEGLRDEALTLSPQDRAALQDAILTEVLRLERLVSNLLDLSRLEVGAAQPRPEIWTLDGLLARALDTLGGAGARVAVTLEPGLRPVRVDGAQAERILVNLIENALEHSPADEPVEVHGADEGDEVVVRVLDRGPGIRPSELDRIFEPFELGAAGAARKGTGLGLAIARGFTQANGGRIWAEPGSDGGATF